MDKIFNNPNQQAASKMQDIIESEKTAKAFNDWHSSLPKLTAEEIETERYDHLQHDILSTEIYLYEAE